MHRFDGSVLEGVLLAEGALGPAREVIARHQLLQLLHAAAHFLTLHCHILLQQLYVLLNSLLARLSKWLGKRMDVERAEKMVLCLEQKINCVHECLFFSSRALFHLVEGLKVLIFHILFHIHTCAAL